MSLISRILPDNPVLTKEMRVRMRGARAYWILLGYLGFLALVLLINYAGWQRNVQMSGSGSSEVSRLGGEMFNYILLTQMFLVLFITPAITSGSLTIEREQRTMDMLMLTRMARRSIIAGKLLAAVLFTALLLISSLPMVSICFMLGSVDISMVVSNYMMMLMGCFLIGAMGLMWSSIAKTTTQAVMYTYGTLFGLFVFGAAAFSVHHTSYISGHIFENMFRALGATWFSTKFLGLTGPEGIGFSALCLAGGLLMAAIAMARLEMWPERKAALLRSLTMLLIGVQLLAANLWWLNNWYSRGGQMVQHQVQPPLAALVITAALLMALVPTFATGEVQPYEARGFLKYLAWGWTPKGLRRGKLASGLPFLTLLTLFCLGLYALSFVFLGKTADIAHSSMYSQMTSQTMGRQVIMGNTSAHAGVDAVEIPNEVASKGDFPQAAIVILASVVGFALLCQFLSVAIKNRWVAWLFGSLFLVVMWVAPELARNARYNGNGVGSSVNLYYFNPAQAIYQMSDYYENDQFLAFGQHVPMWLATTGLWLLVGGVSFALTLWLAARQQQRAVVPYEELVASA